MVNVPDIEANGDGPKIVSIDYMYLNDEDGNKDQPQMVMFDHNHGRVFSYSVPRKGLLGEVEWVPRRMIRALDNMGYNKNVSVQIKPDQEVAIVAVQEYMRLNSRSPTILTNSPVGEPECNGRVENAIRRVTEKARTLIAQLKEGIGEKIQKDLMLYLGWYAGQGSYCQHMLQVTTAKHHTKGWVRKGVQYFWRCLVKLYYTCPQRRPSPSESRRGNTSDP